MISHLKKSSILAAALLISSQLLAQSKDSTVNDVKPFAPNSAYRTWSIGIHGGGLTGYTIFHGKEDWLNQAADIGFGGYVKKQIWHSFALQGNLLMGKMHGSRNSVTASPNTRYQTTIDYAGDITGVLTVANISWGKQQSSIQPYATAGAGYMGYTTATYTAANVKTALSGGKEIMDIYYPIGVGLKFNLNQGINLDLGYQVNFVNNDNIDANITGTTFDKFAYGHIGLEFTIGKSSKPVLATHNPVASMRAEYTVKEMALQNQIDAEKAKNAALRNDLNTTNTNLNATNANLAKFTVDSDTDGVPDFFDKCPNTPAGTKVDGAGCPLPVNKPVTVYITEEDKKVVKDAIANLEFDTGKSTIRAVSFPSLNKVAELLVSKNFSLKLAGHTDNVGSDATNLKLSKNRAEAIKAFLVSKGVNASRIEATGYGESQPIASNTTEVGRQANRRVEFTLY